ncbi:MAG TPA: hypothetical protein VFI06_07025 [Chitinophagaceae bacterium]|nr:hypothetical protein [Chitinophagaceae bacterium]
MNSAIHELAKAVLKKPLDDCSLEELEHLTRQYPYFAPAQLLLAKKLSEEQTDSPAYNEQVQRTSLYFPNRVWLDHLLNDHNGTNTGEATSNNEQWTMPAEQRADAEILINEPAKSEPAVEPTSEVNGIITEPLPPVVEQTNNQDDKPGDPMSNEEFQQPDLPAARQDLPTAESSSLNIATEPEKEGLVFEPFHTVDYFASQGIRFKEEEKPKDHFSVQLKSFTEWLKTIKKSSPAEIAATADPTAEKKVEQMAEYSIAERHVTTEAMAEVWKKQGNKARAEEIYRKLSLLDPSKSSYFAAKIEELKKTS